MNILDLIVIVIFLFNIGICYRRGIVRSVLSFFSNVVSLVAIYVLVPKTVLFIKGLEVYEKFYTIVGEKVGAQINSIFQAISSSNSIENLNIPEFLKSFLQNQGALDAIGISNIAAEGLIKIQTSLTEILSGGLLSISVTFILFFLLNALIRLIYTLFFKYVKNDKFKSFDRNLGIIIGIIQSLVFVWVGLSIFSLTSMLPGNENLSQMLDTSTIALFLQQNNILSNMFISIFKNSITPGV